MTAENSPEQPSLLSRARASVNVLYREIAKFGAVGAIAFVVDFGVFNLMRTGIIGGDHGLAEKPLTAKTISVLAATVVAWVGNRYWTFRHRRRASARREFILFAVMNIGGLAISLACLGFSHYVLGLTSTLADNIAGNVIGLGLGTLFRFWAYRQLVFTTEDEQDLLLGAEQVDPEQTSQDQTGQDQTGQQQTGQEQAVRRHAGAEQGGPAHVAPVSDAVRQTLNDDSSLDADQPASFGPTGRTNSTTQTDSTTHAYSTTQIHSTTHAGSTATADQSESISRSDQGDSATADRASRGGAPDTGPDGEQPSAVDMRESSPADLSRR